MILHLLPIEPPPPAAFAALQEIRLLPGEPKPSPPRLREWVSRPEDQSILHVETGCCFAGLRLERPLIEGLRVPFAGYEIGVRFIGMDGERDMPPPEEVKELGRQGVPPHAVARAGQLDAARRAAQVEADEWRREREEGSKAAGRGAPREPLRNGVQAIKDVTGTVLEGAVTP